MQGETVKLSTSEYALISGVLGASTLIGISDPFPGLLADEVRAALDRVRADLEARGLIQVRADRRVFVDPHTAFLVSTCAFPEATFVLVVNPAGAPPSQRYFHVTRQAAVEMAEEPVPDPSVSLTLLEGAGAVYDRVWALCALGGQGAPPVPAGQLARSELVRARAAAEGSPGTGAEASGVPAARGILEQAGLAPATAAALAATLARPVLNASFVAMAQQAEHWHSHGLGLLLGHNGLWRLGAMMRDGNQWVTVEPCTAADLGAEMRRTMDRVLPRPSGRG